MNKRDVVSTLLAPEVIEGLIEFESAANENRYVNLDDTLVERMIEIGLLFPIGREFLRRTEFGAWVIHTLNDTPYDLPLDCKEDGVH